MDLSQLLIDFLNHYPIFGSIVGMMGILRLIFKPLMVIVHNVVDVTATTRDNAVLGAIEDSRFYGWFLFILDWFASIKIKK